jgi:hypothetical protein
MAVATLTSEPFRPMRKPSTVRAGNGALQVQEPLVLSHHQVDAPWELVDGGVATPMSLVSASRPYRPVR